MVFVIATVASFFFLAVILSLDFIFNKSGAVRPRGSKIRNSIVCLIFLAFVFILVYEITIP